MNSDRVVVEAIKVAQTLLSQNLPPAYNLPDAVTGTRARAFGLLYTIGIGAQQRHVARICLAGVEHVVAEQSQTDREIITRLWDILDDPHLNRALGIAQNSRFMLGPNPKRR
jgi:hypothetical protein